MDISFYQNQILGEIWLAPSLDFTGAKNLIQLLNNIIELIGEIRGPTVTVLQWVQMTVPDPVVFAVSLITVCLIGKAQWVTPALIS